MKTASSRHIFKYLSFGGYLIFLALTLSVSALKAIVVEFIANMFFYQELFYFQIYLLIPMIMIISFIAKNYWPGRAMVMFFGVFLITELLLKQSIVFLYSVEFGFLRFMYLGGSIFLIGLISLVINLVLGEFKSQAIITITICAVLVSIIPHFFRLLDSLRI